MENFQTFSSAHKSAGDFPFPFPLKRPKVYCTRDFPDGCFTDQTNINGSEGCSYVVEHSNGTNTATDVPRKTLAAMKSEPRRNPLASYNRNYDMEQEANVCHLNEVFPPSFTPKEEEKTAASLDGLRKGKNNAFARSADGCKDARNKVKETLKLFQQQYNELLEKNKAELKGDEKGRKRFDVEAANILKKKGKWIHSVKQFGHIPGIVIGDQFQYRAELAVVGLHGQYVAGIDFAVRDGNKFATSVVDSGQYENKTKSVDVLIYSGEGGVSGWGRKGGQGGDARQGSKVDQKLERGNLALVNSKDKGYPIRVIKKRGTLLMNNKRGFVYTYDGLYSVNKHWKERDEHGRLVFKFELYRMSSQERLHPNAGESRKLMSKECCVVDDVSQGKEKMAIRALNGIDGERPQAFAYTNDMIYPEWFKPVPCRGCNCINGCSNSHKCLCISKNGGQIPFSGKGTIVNQKDVVYECGPSCKCPSSCMNRVSQHGLRYKLEIFKTESRGWGVRSPSFISYGNFVCAYSGKLTQQNKIAKEKVDDKQGRIMGFTIDARKLGNVGRFISHSSSSPNLFVQRILYDHEDDRVPHIMLFAAKNILPMQELSCDLTGFQYHLEQ